MSNRLTKTLLALAATALFPATALASGGQPGLELAVDAPWRIEPIPSGNNHAGAPPTYTYGAIPIVVTVHDAIFDVARKKLPTVGLGRFKQIVVQEVIGSDSKKWPITIITHEELTEIEAKYGVSKVGSEPKHELCMPVMGMSNCDQRLPIDAGKKKLNQGSHEWHASFFFTPKTKVTPGKDLQLQVTFSATSGKSYTTRLKVHAAAAPLPRFAKTWLYGDLHYHSQSTDNEGESGYAYRNVVRAMGSMGMDFVFATDHASDSTQTLGGGGGMVDGALEKLGYINDYDEARDLNSARFRWANKAIHGPKGANEVMTTDSALGGKKARYTNFKAYGVVPQIFLGEEIDSLPEMSAAEQKSGTIAWGDRQKLEWWRGDDCVASQMATCSGGFNCPTPGQVEKRCRALRSKKKAGRWYLQDIQGKSVAETTGGSRQHMVYLPYSAKDTEGWVSGRTSEYGGAKKTLAANLAEIEPRGRAFLAHPAEGGAPSNGAGPNMITFSDTALNRAWRSQGIIGLQLWNENDRYSVGPKNAFDGVVVGGISGRRHYQPQLFAGSKWSWKSNTARSKAKCGDCDLRVHLYHAAFTWDRYLRKGLDPAKTKTIAWLPKGSPRRWMMAGGSDAHGDLNFRRHGRPDKCIKAHTVSVEFKQWCDTPVSDTAIGTPRNLVHVGNPKGKGSGALRRHSNRQVIDSLEAGRFSVTDGPALRVVVDKNRNGKIDGKDFEMGALVDIFPGERIPVLVEWFSTPEFGPIQRMDLYVGNKARTYAAAGHGPSGRIGHTTAADGTRTQVNLSESYASDPSGVLATTKGMTGPRAMHGMAKLELDPKQFGVTGTQGALFYLRAYVQTGEGSGKVAGRMAFSNPVWGRNHTACPAKAPATGGKQVKGGLPTKHAPVGKLPGSGKLPTTKTTPTKHSGGGILGSSSLDADGNRVPDVCEGKVDKKNGSTRTIVSLGGTPGVSPPKTSGTKPKAKLPTTHKPVAKPPAGLAKSAKPFSKK